jgi:hypothetical protein
VCDARVDQREDSRPRSLRAAPETQRLQKLGEGALVLASTLYHDDVGLGVAQSLRGLDEGSRLGRANTRHDLRARRERDTKDREARGLFATVEEGDAKRSTERDGGSLDGDLGPDRDRHRGAVVVRAAS